MIKKTRKKLLASSVAAALLVNNAGIVSAMEISETPLEEVITEVTEETSTNNLMDVTETTQSDVELESNEEELIVTVTEPSTEATQEVVTEVSEEVIMEAEALVNEEEVSTTEVKSVEYNVTNATQLQEALAKEGAIINLLNNIDISEKLNANAKNVTINGGGFTLNINETTVTNLFMVRGSGLKINDLTITGYSSSAMYLLNAKDIVLTDVNLYGKDDKSSLVGIDADNSTITLEKVNTKNHRYSAFRVRKNSSIDYRGGNTSTNDNKQVECLEDGGSNTITNNNSGDPVKYTVIDTSIVNGVKKVYYALAHSIDVDTYEELVDAVTKPNSIINIVGDITLDGEITIKQDKIVINGNGNTINCNKDYKITVSSKNVNIDKLNFENYITGGLSIYNATNAKLTQIKMLGNPKTVSYEERSKAGIDIYNSTVQIGAIETYNHLWRGIQVRNGSTVTVNSQNKHYGDRGHLQVLYDGENSGNISQIVDVIPYYEIENEYTDPWDDKIINYYNPSYYNKPEFVGLDHVEITMGSEFIELEGVTVTDIEDGTIDNSKIQITGDYNVNVPGKYLVIYFVEDYDENVTEFERWITVKPHTDVDDDNMVDTDKLPSFPNYDVDDDMGVITPSSPNYDVDDDMMVDTDNLPSFPNYDVDDDMMVDTDNLPSFPNYDVDDNMGVITPSSPNYDVDDEMGVVPSTPDEETDNNLGTDQEENEEGNTNNNNTVVVPGQPENSNPSTGGESNKPTVDNQENVEKLPQTGDTFSRLLMMFGSFFLALAGLLLMKRPRTNE